MEQQIKKEKEQFLLKVSECLFVVVDMDSAPSSSGFILILGVQLKPTTRVLQQNRKKLHLRYC